MLVNGLVDIEYRSYHKSAQCMLMVNYYWYVHYYRYVRIICQHDSVCVCVCGGGGGGDSSLSRCISSAKIILGSLVTSDDKLSLCSLALSPPPHDVLVDFVCLFLLGCVLTLTSHSKS